MEESVDLHEEAGKENEQTLANLSPAEEATSKDEVEIEKFLQEQKSKNTQYKTKSDLNAWKKFCESLKESREIETIPANELDLLLSKFFISDRKQNGTEYEPATLSGFRRSFQRYLDEKPSEYLHYNTAKCLMSRNLARQISRDLRSHCFAMVLTAGFYCDSRAHNVRKVRVVKYIVIYGQIKAADQKYCHK